MCVLMVLVFLFERERERERERDIERAIWVAILGGRGFKKAVVKLISFN